MRSHKTETPTSPAVPTKLCSECLERKPANAEAYFCTSLTRDQLSDRCRVCVMEEAKRSRLERAARKEHRLALRQSPANTTTN